MASRDEWECESKRPGRRSLDYTIPIK